MSVAKKACEFDVIELTEDLPAYDLKRGQQGTIVEVFDTPALAYIVEFIDASGALSRIADLVRPEQVKVVWRMKQ